MDIAASSATTKRCLPSDKRNLKVMRNILILLTIVLYGGIASVILIIWNTNDSQPILEEWCLLSCNSVIFLVW